MESVNSASCESQPSVGNPSQENQSLANQWFIEQLDELLPKIQERWPDLARQTLETTRGSIDELVRVISEHSDKTNYGVREQLEELFNTAGNRTKDLADSLEPLEKQLEELLDELNKTLRPRIEEPVRQRPLLALGIAAGVGLFLGVLLSGGRKN